MTRRLALAAVAALVAATVPLGLTVVGAGAQPAAPAAASGTRTGTGPNGQKLTVTPANDLDRGGATVNVKGSGYDVGRGIYVAFCVDQGPGQAPSPCVGGVDMNGTGGASKWISSNPPPVGVGLAQPFGPGGTFDVDLEIAPQDEFVDCLDGSVTCKVVTRADHTAPTNRTADVKVAITWADPDPGSSTTSTSRVPSTTATTQAPVEGPNGSRSARGAGGQSLTVTPADDLNPAGAAVRVQGSGYDPSVGIYVAFCVDAGSARPPSPCVGGADTENSSGASVWISNNPPDYGVDLSQRFGPGGTFDVTLNVRATDEGINCLDGSTRCVIASRADHTQSANRTADVKVPILFVGQTSPNAGSPSATAAQTVATARFTG